MLVISPTFGVNIKLFETTTYSGHYIIKPPQCIAIREISSKNPPPNLHCLIPPKQVTSPQNLTSRLKNDGWKMIQFPFWDSLWGKMLNFRGVISSPPLFVSGRHSARSLTPKKPFCLCHLFCGGKISRPWMVAGRNHDANFKIFLPAATVMLAASRCCQPWPS